MIEMNNPIGSAMLLCIITESWKQYRGIFPIAISISNESFCELEQGEIPTLSGHRDIQPKHFTGIPLYHAIHLPRGFIVQYSDGSQIWWDPEKDKDGETEKCTL